MYKHFLLFFWVCSFSHSNKIGFTSWSLYLPTQQKIENCKTNWIHKIKENINRIRVYPFHHFDKNASFTPFDETIIFLLP